MSKLKVVLDIPGLDELRNDSSILDELREIGERVVNATSHPEDYELEVGQGKKRAHATVKTATFRAMQKNLDGNELLKALESVGPYKKV